MKTKSSWLGSHILLLSLALVVTVSGCATPPAIKSASKTQIQLVGELDQSIAALKAGIVQFEEDNQTEIREVGRIQIANQAINDFIDSGGIHTTNGVIAVDTLFQVSNEKIRPFVDFAFSDLDYGTNTVNIDTLGKTPIILPLLWSKATPPVSQINTQLIGDIQTYQVQEKRQSELLDATRAQVGLMKVVATTVDAWLEQDVTISQGQADNLETAVINTTKSIGGGK